MKLAIRAKSPFLIVDDLKYYEYFDAIVADMYPP